MVTIFIIKKTSTHICSTLERKAGLDSNFMNDIFINKIFIQIKEEMSKLTYILHFLYLSY
jgi:hypothetical protein